MSHRRTVYLVEDDLDVRRSLASRLDVFGIDTRPYASGLAFTAELDHLQPACVLLSIDVPPMGGLEILSDLAQCQIDWPVIVLGGEVDVALAVRAMKLGAVDYLLKPIDGGELESTLRYAACTLERSVRDREMRRSAQNRVKSLSPREVDISLALLGGLANKSVAHQLGISVRTVEMHRANIMAKLGVRSLAEAAIIATQAGMTLCRQSGAPGVPLLHTAAG